MSSDDPVQQGEATAAAVAPIVSASEASAASPAARFNNYFSHLSQAFQKEHFTEIQASEPSGADGEMFVTILHKDTTHDLPTLCAAVAAAPTAYPEFLTRASTEEPNRCCAVVLSTLSRCRSPKSSNDETCKLHDAQSLASLLTNYSS